MPTKPVLPGPQLGTHSSATGEGLHTGVIYLLKCVRSSPRSSRTEKDYLYHLHLRGASLLPVGPPSQKARPLREDGNVVSASGNPGPCRPQGSVWRLFSTDPQSRPIFTLQMLSSEMPLQLLPMYQQRPETRELLSS